LADKRARRAEQRWYNFNTIENQALMMTNDEDDGQQADLILNQEEALINIDKTEA